VSGGEQIGLAHHLLDHQMLDTRGERCGKADDVALREVDGRVELHAILAGAGVLQARYPGPLMHWLVGLGGSEQVVVPAHVIGKVDGHVHLTQSAPSLGLASGEQRAAGTVARILGPDAHAAALGRTAAEQGAAPIEELAPDVMRLAQLIGRRAVDETGAPLGRLRDLRFERSGRMLGEAAGAAWVLTHALVGRRGLAERFGLYSGDRGALAVEGLVVREDGQVTLRGYRRAA
jgi:sporulation protein YlmC with PRC-barrel domain